MPQDCDFLCIPTGPAPGTLVLLVLVPAILLSPVNFPRLLPMNALSSFPPCIQLYRGLPAEKVVEAQATGRRGVDGAADPGPAG